MIPSYQSVASLRDLPLASMREIPAKIKTLGWGRQ
jgi:hypothetical protein